MAIQFTHYPVSNRVPGVYVEMDPSQANTATTFQRSLILGQISDEGAATPLTPVEIESLAQVYTLCGRGSILSQMAQAYLTGDNFGDLWLLPYEDNPAGAKATGTVTFTGAPTEPGTLNLYIGGIRVQAPVHTADTPTTIAAAMLAAMATVPDLAVDGTAALGVLTLTAKNAGDAGNNIDVRFNYLGQAGREFMPPGVTTAIVPMTGGAGNPDIVDGLANLADTTFDFIVTPYTDTANLNALRDFLDDNTGRWSWEQMLYGGGFSAFEGTLGECTAFGNGRNDQHMSIMAYNDSPDPPWVWAAIMGALSAASLRVDPGLPLQYISTPLKAPPVESRWSIGERNTLLYDGMSTYRVGDDGSVVMERMCTTYQKNTAGAADDSYLDVETMYGLMFVARDLANYLLTRYARKKLVSDTTPILPGSNTVNAPMIRASVISEYRALETAGYVQNSANFARNIVVENAGQGLVKVLAPVDLVNQLRQIAILLQFRKS